jgi:hypothetical protein
VAGGACRPPPPDPRPAPAAQGELAGPTAVSASRCEPGTGLGSGVKLALPPGTASARRAKARPHALRDFCLYGCFSRTQYVVFAAKVANARSKLGRDRSHTAGSVRHSSPKLWPGPGTALNCGATGPQARRNVGNHPPLLTTTSGGLLKQPYKQDVTRRVDTPLREYVGRAHRPYGNRKRRAELRHCLQGLLRWHPACTARVWGSKRFFTFGALPPDWLSAPRCDSTGCSGVFFWE